MRYQKDIVERLRQGLAAIDRQESENFVNEFSRPRQTLKEFADDANQYFGKLLTTATGSAGKVPQIGIPENTDAIPYWIEDLENAVHPDLRVARAMQ